MIPFWPFLMGAAALLTVWGAALGAWKAPALALIGYIGARAVIMGVPEWTHEVALCTLWLSITAAMGYNGAWVPSFFYTLSACTYPALLIFGVRLEYLGLSAIVAECFAVLALLSIGGGLGGVAFAGRNHARFTDWLAVNAVGMAAR